MVVVARLGVAAVASVAVVLGFFLLSFLGFLPVSGSTVRFGVVLSDSETSLRSLRVGVSRGSFDFAGCFQTVSSGGSSDFLVSFVSRSGRFRHKRIGAGIGTRIVRAGYIRFFTFIVILPITIPQRRVTKVDSVVILTRFHLPFS